MQATSVIGLLLAAGSGVRFDPTGDRNKLMQPLAKGLPVAVSAAVSLLAETAMVIAVVQSEDSEVAHALRSVGCRIVECAAAAQGMGASLACGLRAAPKADGYLIALADMPYVKPATLAALVDAIAHGADIAAPIQNGRRGNPVAFSAWHLPRLLQLSADKGARELLKIYPVQEIPVSDTGIFEDIDSPMDLQRLQMRAKAAG